MIRTHFGLGLVLTAAMMGCDPDVGEKETADTGCNHRAATSTTTGTGPAPRRVEVPRDRNGHRHHRHGYNHRNGHDDGQGTTTGTGTGVQQPPTQTTRVVVLDTHG